MSEYQRAVPVLHVANAEISMRWYVDVLGFTPDGHRVCVSGDVPPGANVKPHVEWQNVSTAFAATVAGEIISRRR
jgi:hypothetical protein